MKKLKFLAIFLFAFFMFFFMKTEVSYAFNPLDVPSNIKSNWNNSLGSKRNSMTSGRKLVYDIYFNKYVKSGYEIVTKNFGISGDPQPYLHFTGWAINFGRQHHTSSNHNTYIVTTSPSGTKYFRTQPINISATEDVEYNNKGAGDLQNPCSNNDRNKENTECNMRYENVGFHAWIPLNELFSDANTSKTWQLWIVKEVNGHIIHAPLVLPFEFENKKFLSGMISLSSGQNANNLIMTSSVVMRREYPRQVVNMWDYFTLNRTYIRVDQDEASTAIWYGVRSPHDNNQTRWASSAYWEFGGDQAKLSYVPSKLEHRSTTVEGATYVSGNTYWIEPGKQVTIVNEGRSVHDFLNFHHRLTGSGTDGRYGYAAASKSVSGWQTWTNFDYVSGSKTAETRNSSWHTLQTKVNVRAKSNITDVKTHNIQYWYKDVADQEIGYSNTGKSLNIDGAAPTLNSSLVENYTYHKDNTYWVKPGRSVDISIRQHDQGSGNKRQYIRFLENGLDVRSWHNYQSTNTSHIEPIFTSSHLSINSTSRVENANNYGKIKWNVTPKTHGYVFDIQTYFQDNVNNTRGYLSTGKKLGADGVAPSLDNATFADYVYKNGSTYWIKPDQKLKLTLRQYDGHSGNRFQYLKLTGNGENVRGVHSFLDASSTNMGNVSTFPTATDNVALSAQRSENSAYGTVTWTIHGKTHGTMYDIWYHFTDNVHNSYGYDTGVASIGKMGVDGVAPTVYYRNAEDTADIKSSDWQSKVDVLLKFTDEHSGYKHSRYAWTQSTQTPTSWSNWTTNNNYIVNQSTAGIWYLHVQASDNVGNVRTTVAGPFKVNTPPVVTVTYKPNEPSYDHDEPYEGDNVQVCAHVVDYDNQLMEVEILISKNYGEPEQVVFETGVPSDSTICYEFETDKSRYDIEVNIDDGYETTTVTTWFETKPLIIIGHVDHTPEWEKKHIELGNTLDKFFSGEKFLLSADTSEYPTEYVKATLHATQSDGKAITYTVYLYKQSMIFYKGELFDEAFLVYPTSLNKGPATWTFEVRYTNGVIKKTDVPIHIIIDGNVFDVYRFHRRY